MQKKLPKNIMMNSAWQDEQCKLITRVYITKMVSKCLQTTSRVNNQPAILKMKQLQKPNNPLTQPKQKQKSVK